MRYEIKKLILIAVFIFSVSAVYGDDHIAEVPLDTVQAALKKVSAQHPRLFVNDKQLKKVMRDIDASPELKMLHKELVLQADILISKKPLERVQTGKRLLSVSRAALKRIFTLSWAYRSTGDEKYLKRAEREMLAVSKFSDWNPNHFLDVGEMTAALAVGYDWLYNGLSVQSRDQIRQAIIEKALTPSFSGKRNWVWWIDWNNNWNQVCHGGLSCGALAIIEDEPKMAEQIIHRTVNKVQIAMAEYEPDGAYPEGPTYWAYGTTYNVILLAALDSALGTDFGLSEKGGFARSAEYYLHATGPTGLFFNYADSETKGVLEPAMMWFAKKYDDPSLLWNQKKLWGTTARHKSSDLTKKRCSVLSLVWGLPEAVEPKQLCWMGRGLNPVAMFRTSWDDDAVYLGVKGGSPSCHHGHMDVGSFVVDYDGVRWALDLGREDYHRIESLGLELWDVRQAGQRWNLFRYNNFSHNTLTVNGTKQLVKGFAPVIRYSDDPKFPHAAVDMSEVYKGQLNKAVRGFSLLPSGQILIQDELEATDKPAKVRWNMVTGADVDIESGKSAMLRQKGKTMQLRVVTGSDVKLATYSTAPRSEYDGDNGKTCMVGFDVELDANEKVTVRVMLIPGAKEQAVEFGLKDIEKWSDKL